MKLRSVSLSPAYLINVGALSYVFCVYGLGLVLICQASVGLWLLGIVLLIHALALSAIVLHEFLHDNPFKHKATNAFWGKAMTWLNGACYVPYERLVRHHFKHHVHHADFVAFDIQQRITALPAPLKHAVVLLEWAYLPVVELWLRGRNFVEPFTCPEQAHRRGRTLAIAALRVLLFALLALHAPWALVAYGIAYLCFVNLMRFVDAFHHTYSYVIEGEAIPERDRTYEQANTFSNLVSERFPWFNLLFLNFGYHNAHHHNMRCPWYELPQLHAKLYGCDGGAFQENRKILLPLFSLMGNYHRFRIQRLFDGQGDQSHSSALSLDATLASPERVSSGPATTTFAVESFTGGIGVSLLTPP